MTALLLLTACDGRAVPTDHDGLPPSTDASADGCIRPPGGCFSGGDCPTGFECLGCGPDPCCPGCRVCYGRCVPAGDLPSCSGNQDCDPGQFCQIPDGCVVTRLGAGRCTPIPQACDLDYNPVCGCDGESYGNRCAAHSAAMNVDHPGTCTDPACANTVCTVVDDCCQCTAAQGTVPPCPANCENTMCPAFGLMHPVAYCLQGQCLLTDDQLPCASDADCMLIDDCCNCLALPVGLPFATCLADCFVSQCTAIGLAAATARCVGGICKLSLN